MIATYKTFVDHSTRLTRLVKERDYDMSSSCLGVIDAIHIVNTIFFANELAEEYGFLLCLNSAGDIISAMEVSHNTVNMAFASNREIFLRAILCGATSIIFVHNHPSGHVEPSQADIGVAKNLLDAGKLMGISVLDCIIIANDEYYSFKESMPRLFKS